MIVFFYDFCWYFCNDSIFGNRIFNNRIGVDYDFIINNCFR